LQSFQLLNALAIVSFTTLDIFVSEAPEALVTYVASLVHHCLCRKCYLFCKKYPTGDNHKTYFESLPAWVFS